MNNILQEIWKNTTLVGRELAVKQPISLFKNSELALKMLYKHICANSKIVIHCDVDMDGIGSGYIIGKAISTISNIKPIYIINSERTHGIQQKHADYFKNKRIDLLIIVDSSCNELEIIKQFDCDVLVIDHHELEHTELSGKVNDGKHNYIIVNNTIDNSEDEDYSWLCNNDKLNTIEICKNYEADDRMSCGLVVYELMELFCYTYGYGSVMQNLRLFQWVGVTLFSDTILLNTSRNQWYIENTVYSDEIELTLQKLLQSLNPYKRKLDKSFILYTLVPTINRAIRAGASNEAANVVLFHPEKVNELSKYREIQDKTAELALKYAVEHEHFVEVDLTKLDISDGYNGLIAIKIKEKYDKNAIAYKIINGIVSGSFRGTVSSIDYRQYIDNYSETSKAQGHKVAFGFECDEHELEGMMNSLIEIEQSKDKGLLLTAGILNTVQPGKFTIADIDSFRRQGGIWELAIGNSKLSSDEQIEISVSKSDATLVETKGKLYIYEVLGFTCKAFEPITEKIVNIYPEYSGQIEIYIK